MISKLNADQFLEMAIAGKEHLEKHVDEVNALNELPIPDHDTGTNMVRTMASTAIYAKLDTKEEEDLSIGEVALRVYMRAGISAKGKSGEILALFFDGFVGPLKNMVYMNSISLMKSFQNAQANLIFHHEKTGNSIPEIMQMIEKMVDAAERLHDKSSLATIMYRMVADAQKHVRETEITDAGCIGLLYVMEGMALYLMNTKE